MRVYVGSDPTLEQPAVYALDAATGSVVWVYDVEDAPDLHGRGRRHNGAPLVVFGAQNGGMYATSILCICI